MRRKTIGGMEFSLVDENDGDTEYIYNEVFNAQIYYHQEMRIPRHPTIMDVGANIGIYAVWAHRRYQPKALLCYEASPRTYTYLQDNLQRLVDGSTTRAVAINRAVAGTAGQMLVLHQSTRVSGISTLVDRSKVGWIGEASAGHQLETHEIATTTVSAEMSANQLAAVDVLKIDVEGYFLEVLKGITDKDFAGIRNIVVEVDYLPETGIKASEVEDLLIAKGYKTDCLDRSQTNNLTFYAWRT